MDWFLDCVVYPYAYRLPEVVKKLTDKLELDEYQIDKQIDHYIQYAML